MCVEKFRHKGVPFIHRVYMRSRILLLRIFEIRRLHGTGKNLVIHISDNTIVTESTLRWRWVFFRQNFILDLVRIQEKTWSNTANQLNIHTFCRTARIILWLTSGSSKRLSRTLSRVSILFSIVFSVRQVNKIRQCYLFCPYHYRGESVPFLK